MVEHDVMSSNPGLLHQVEARPGLFMYGPRLTSGLSHVDRLELVSMEPLFQKGSRGVAHHLLATREAKGSILSQPWHLNDTM